MTFKVNMHEAKTHLSRLVERALAGEDVVIASNGRGLVRLIPLESPEAGLRPIGLHAVQAKPARPLAEFEHHSLTPLDESELAAWSE
jgi:prevent-host-death family protein